MRLVAFSVLFVVLTSCTTAEFEPIPSAPVLVAPEQHQVFTGGEITLTWEPVPEANRYALHVDGELAALTSETSVNINLSPKQTAYCWQVIAQDNVMQFPSVIQCFEVREPTVCIDQTVELTWPADPKAERYIVTVIHKDSQTSSTYQRREPNLEIPSDPLPGQYFWSVARADEFGAQLPIAEGSYFRNDRPEVHSLVLIGPEDSESPFRFRWEAAKAPFHLELSLGTCAAPGTPVEGWPRVRMDRQIAIDPSELDFEQSMAFRVQSLADSCPGATACHVFIPEVQPPNQVCDADLVESLTWHNVTPHNYITSVHEPAIVYDESRESFVMMSGPIVQRLQVNASLEVEATRLDVKATETYSSAQHAEGALIYDPVNHRNIIFSPSQFGLDTHFLDLNRFDRWQTFPKAGGAHPTQRGDHVATLDPRRQRMIIYGGWDDRELWSMNLRTDTPIWQELPAQGALPEAHWAMISWYDPDNHRMMMFGGSSMPTQITYSDTYALDLTTDSWEQVNTTGDIPERRAEFAGTQCGCYFVASHGFRTVNDSLDDTYVLVNNREWVKPTINGTPPVADWGFDAAWDPINRVILVVGGGRFPENMSSVYMLTGL